MTNAEEEFTIIKPLYLFYGKLAFAFCILGLLIFVLTYFVGGDEQDRIFIVVSAVILLASFIFIVYLAFSEPSSISFSDNSISIRTFAKKREFLRSDIVAIRQWSQGYFLGSDDLVEIRIAKYGSLVFRSTYKNFDKALQWLHDLGIPIENG